jgi:aldehyde dehydrogenase (NAD+)
MTDVTPTDAVMGEEIFGPIMPILSFDTIDEVYALVEAGSKPLALYIFTEDQRLAKEVSARLAFGGGCINDVVIHLATTEMGFGGVGESGMGAYHGKRGFDSFSHLKSIVKKSTVLDLPMRYQPYRKTYFKLLRKFLK